MHTMTANTQEPASPDLVWDAERLTDPHQQPDKARRVRQMFDAIAPTYERVNTVSSGAQDVRWRRRMVRLARLRPGDVVLDVACGTGDVTRAFAGAEPRPDRIVGVDFAGAMLELAAARPIDDGAFIQGDALRLPIASASVSVVSCAFGIRNFENLTAGLREMHRVLVPGGRAVVLEFAVPAHPIFRRLYLWYVNQLMPLLATWISRDRTGAYRYLPRSVLSFTTSAQVAAAFRNAGFSEVDVHHLSWGIVAVYVASKS